MCNMTDKPVTLSLAAEMQGLKLKGKFFAEATAAVGCGVGAMSLNALLKLAPYGVYVGELQY